MTSSGDPTPRTLRVAINALINPANAGGSESSALSIIYNLRDQSRADLEMFVTALPKFVNNMHRVRGDSDKVICWPWPEFTPISSQMSSAYVQKLRAHLGDTIFGQCLDDLIRLANRRSAMRRMPSRQMVDHLLDRHEIDVVHFTYPVKWPTSRPFIFEPHDIQHRHYPEFFSRDTLKWREETYGSGIRDAAFVVCGTWWTKKDIIKNYGVSARKVAVIPRTSVMGHSEVSSAKEAELAVQLGLPSEFVYYPAMTFPHKNHMRLLEALADLRQRESITIPLVCTGRPYKPFHGEILHAVKRLGLQDQVHFLGRVSEEALSLCYKRCTAVVFPSLLEGLSQSLLEALSAGKPILASKASSIPETVGNAGLFFDPFSPREIVDVLKQAWSDSDLRGRLERSCEGAIARFQWSNALVTLVACYKQAAGRRLNESETEALERALSEDMV